MRLQMGNLETADSPESNPEVVETVEIPEGVPPESRSSQQFALFAFIAIFVAILGSAVLYLASRRSEPTAEVSSSRVPAPAAAPAPVATVPPKEPATVAVTPPAQQPTEPVAAPASAPATSTAVSVPPIPALNKQQPPDVFIPQPGRWYLQVGSLEKRVAEIMSQGLRIKGIPATVAPGVTPLVSRIIAGPFDDTAQMASAEKQLRELGFQPFPRKFDATELREPPAQTAAQQPPGGSEAAPAKPDVRR